MTFTRCRALVCTFLISITAPLWADDTADPRNPDAVAPAIIYHNPYDGFRAANEPARVWQSAFSTPEPVASATPEAAEPQHNHAQHSVADSAQAAVNHDGAGIIVLLSANSDKIKLKHGLIKKLAMPAMTMTYRVASPELLKGLKPGDAINFDIQEQGDDYVITAIVRKEQ